MEKLKNLLSRFGISRIIVSIVFIIMVCALEPLELGLGTTMSGIITRVGMNGVLILAMMISVYCGAGLNFGLPIGIVGGMLAGSLVVEWNITGMTGFLLACLMSIPFGAVMGYAYGLILTKIRGSEMTIGNYLGFSVVYLSCVLWLVLPYKNPLILWPIGGNGLRVTMTLDGFFNKILDHFWEINFKTLGIFQDTPWASFVFPTGLILVFALFCLIVWIFTKTKKGIILRIGGAYPSFSGSLGIRQEKSVIFGSVASMTLAAVGINIYSQSYGFYQFYTAPLKMAFPAMAAVLIGGATVKKASVFDVVFGAVIYLGFLAMGTPIANVLLNNGSASEIVRLILQNGIILYALTKINRKGEAK